MTTQAMRQTLAESPRLEKDLVDAGRVVGWITGHMIGFRGFGDETEASHAAWVAYRTLARRIARTHGMRLVPIDVEPLALRRSDSGDADVILASNRPIAELIRPGSESRTHDSFGFELEAPSRMTQFEVRGAAYLIYRTLRKSGIRWAMWRPETPAREQQPTTDADSSVTRADEPVMHEPVMHEPVAHESVTAALQPGKTLLRQAFRRLGDRLRLTTDAIRAFTRDWQPTVYK